MRILALIEATGVSGPVKNLLQFHEESKRTGLVSGIEIALATFEREKGSNNSEFIDAVAAHDIPLYVIRERYRFDPRALDDLRRIVREATPDVIETHAVKSHFLVRISGIWKSIPWIAFCHGYTYADLRSPLYNSLDRWTLKTPDRIVAVSGAFAQQLQRRGVPGSRISVLHNAVQSEGKERSVERARQTRRETGFSGNERVLVSIGRLSREKAQIDLIDALVELRRLEPGLSIRLLIVGDGPERRIIERATQSAGLARHVTFTGHVRNVDSYYEIAEVIVIPSLSEGSPNVLLEAMAARVPVVAAAVGGIPEIVTHEKSALLVQPRSPVAMARAIQSILLDPSLADTLTDNAYVLAKSAFTPENRARALCGLYDRVYRESKGLSRAGRHTYSVLSS